MLMRLRIAEIGEDAVSHVLGDIAPELERRPRPRRRDRPPSTSRKSSGSRREASAVEPTRSQNMTVSCRRSAELAAMPASPPRRTGSVDGTGAPEIGEPSRNAAIAASSFRRWPIDVTPSPIRSSAVSFGRISASISFARNAVANCSSPRPRSQLVMSIDIAGSRSPVEASPPTAISPSGAHHGSPSGRREQPGGHHVNSDYPQHYALNASGKEAINLGSISASGPSRHFAWV